MTIDEQDLPKARFKIIFHYGFIPMIIPMNDSAVLMQRRIVQKQKNKFTRRTA